MKKRVSVFFLIIISFCSFSQNADSLNQQPRQIPYWTLWVPGASYFHQGKIVEGSLFSALEIVLFQQLSYSLAYF